MKSNSNCTPKQPRHLFRQKPKSGEAAPPTGRRALKTVLIVVSCVLAAALLCGVGVAVYLRMLKDNPADYFNTVTVTPTPTAAPTPTVTEPDATPSPSPTLSPYEQLQASADTSMMKDVVNVMMIGVDYAEERETWDGKHAFHSDVMIVMSIDFNQKTVDLISLPRDTYAKIPGVEGKYKLNASIDCGGGWPTESGFEKVCEAAEWMLGGIPVDYYFAVSMPVVKELVDIIGGVEYNVEMDFSMQGRDYKAGLQYLDGQGVLDYCRVRSDIAEAGDQYRVNRQKEIMLALFEVAKSRKIIAKIPEIVTTFQGDLYTNCNYEQIAALALFAYGLSSENVVMHSMGGEYYDIFNWGFCITDQVGRVQIIYDVYGVWVPEYEEYSEKYCLKEWGEMKAEHYVKYSRELFEDIAVVFEADLPVATDPPSEEEPSPSPTVSVDPAATADPTPSASIEPPPTPTPRFSEAQHAKYARLKMLYGILSGTYRDQDGNLVYYEGQPMLGLCQEYRDLFPVVAEMAGVDGNISWYIPLEYDIAVDFN